GVSILNFHHVEEGPVRLNEAWERVVAFDETGGDRSDRRYRTQGWQFILSGGGVFDHLDFSFSTDRPDGTAVPLPPGTPAERFTHDGGRRTLTPPAHAEDIALR